jgi:hypothetical protein
MFQLCYLHLNGTQVGDGGLKSLKGLPRLCFVCFDDGQVGAEALEDYCREFPNRDVILIPRKENGGLGGR